MLGPGTRVGGRYLIIEPISTGSMGAVYRAADPGGGADVALKRLLDHANAARFEIEARLLAALHHPRVVRVRGAVSDDWGSWIVMSLVEGPSLAALLETEGRPGLPVTGAAALVGEACEALAYVHAQGVVHRDVKPSNLIRSRDGVVLVDFGVARPAAVGLDAGTAVAGTPGYMAPEVHAGGAVTPRSDVYSVAATFWALATGFPPAFGTRTPLSDHAPGSTREVDAAVAAALEPDPARRTPSVQAFAAGLGAGPLPGAEAGRALACSVARPGAPAGVLEAIVRAAASLFESAAVSIAFLDAETGDLVYESAWGAGATEIVGVRLALGTGIAGDVIASGRGAAVPSCRTDPRFAAEVAERTGYVPNTMLVVPLRRGGATIGVLSILDRRDGRSYGPADVDRAAAFVELAGLTLGLQLRAQEDGTRTGRG